MITLTDEEKKILEYKMLCFGYDEYETTFFETDEYKRLRIDILDNLPVLNDERLKFKFCDKSEVLSAGRYVLDKHCDGIDLKIPYTNGDDLETQIISRFGEKPSVESYDEIIEYIKNNIELVRVTDIPLYLDSCKGRNGTTTITWFYSNKDLEESFFECTHGISVFGPCDEHAKTIYVHEMYHALLDRNKGSLRNLLNKEFLSIFMEKVAAYDLDNSGNLLELNNLYRLLSIKKNIIKKLCDEVSDQNAEGIITCEGYIISGLLATDLFNIYMRGSNRLRKEIDSSINEVLMGNGVIEDVIDKYEVTLEKGSKLLKRQIKHFS